MWPSLVETKEVHGQQRYTLRHFAGYDFTRFTTNRLGEVLIDNAETLDPNISMQSSGVALARPLLPGAGRISSRVPCSCSCKYESGDNDMLSFNAKSA
jgi:hypothetical protein